MAVSQIAKDTLLATNRASQLGKFEKLILALNPFTDGQSNSFAEAAVWADDIKSYGAKFFDNYHFINIVYDPHFLFKGMTDQQLDINAINTIEWAMKILKSNRDNNSFERALMARFLLHIVGDLHQPLHSVNMFNETYKNGDLGGNLVKIVTLKAEAVNLHAYMDSMAEEQSMTDRIPRPLNEQGKAYLSQLVASIEKQYPLDSFTTRMVANATTHSWAVESVSMAMAQVYPYFQSKNVVDQSYQDAMRALCRSQVAIAGYRLADLIASIYG